MNYNNLHYVIYCCIIFSHYSDFNSFKYVSVIDIPTGFPKIEVHPESKEVDYMANFSLNCGATGHPKPNITWLHQYFPLDINEHSFEISGNGESF